MHLLRIAVYILTTDCRPGLSFAERTITVSIQPEVLSNGLIMDFTSHPKYVK